MCSAVPPLSPASHCPLFKVLIIYLRAKVRCTDEARVGADPSVHYVSKDTCSKMFTSLQLHLPGRNKVLDS